MTGIVRAKSISHHIYLKSEEKARLRAELLARRRQVWAASGALAADAVAHRGVRLMQSLGYDGPIGAYHALTAELDPLPLVLALHASGCAIALPCMSEGPTLTFRRWSPGSPLIERKFGVREPAETEPELHPEVVFVPLVAFDARGNRLGYGAGYYDGALRDRRARGRILAIGVAFDEQEVAEIPREPQDEPLDMILTPSRAMTCGA